MNTGKTLFAQLMEFLPWKAFSRLSLLLAPQISGALNAGYAGNQIATTSAKSAGWRFTRPGVAGNPFVSFCSRAGRENRAV
jgi:hypothetical protein